MFYFFLCEFSSAIINRIVAHNVLCSLPICIRTYSKVEL